MRLHFNKSNGIFSVRRDDRSTLVAYERRLHHDKIPFIGEVVSLSPCIHLLITRAEFVQATFGSRPSLTAVVTRLPKVRLFIKRVLEVF